MMQLLFTNGKRERLTSTLSLASRSVIVSGLAGLFRLVVWFDQVHELGNQGGLPDALLVCIVVYLHNSAHKNVAHPQSYGAKGRLRYLLRLNYLTFHFPSVTADCDITPNTLECVCEQ